MEEILCLDFDGVLHSYSSGWKGARNIPDPPVEGAMAFLCKAVEEFDVAIHSSRSRYFGGRRAMRHWLTHQMTDYLWTTGRDDPARINLYTSADYEEHYALRAEALIRQISFPFWKPPAHVTIDDRALTFSGTWPAFPYLHQFTPWNREGANCPTYLNDHVITGLRDKLKAGWKLVPPEEG